MKVSIKYHLSLDSKNIAEKLTNNNKLGTFWASEWHRLIVPFTPMQTGVLANFRVIKPYQIIYMSEYAGRLYFGKTFNFRKDKNKKATAFWSEKAEATQKGKLIKALELFIEREKVLK